MTPEAIAKLLFALSFWSISPVLAQAKACGYISSFQSCQ
jgi:hypothetical protein